MDISKKIMKKLKREYYNIYNEFYEVNKYRKMKNILHHGIARIEHINRVGKLTFYTSKLLKLDYISSTRGALMHDFFIKEDLSKKEALKHHPQMALKNSKKYFTVNKIEEDIITKHMFPITKQKPKYKESILVCICDKLVSCYEFIRFKINIQANLIMMFIINTLYS